MTSLAEAEAEIAAERKRQIEGEGWTLAHDDGHGDGSLEKAADCYRDAPPMVRIERVWVGPDRPDAWPWHWSSWKPTFRRGNLIKAGALYMAEIERLGRLNKRNPAGIFGPDAKRRRGTDDRSLRAKLSIVTSALVIEDREAAKRDS